MLESQNVICADRGASGDGGNHLFHDILPLLREMGAGGLQLGAKPVGCPGGRIIGGEAAIVTFEFDVGFGLVVTTLGRLNLSFGHDEIGLDLGGPSNFEISGMKAAILHGSPLIR